MASRLPGCSKEQLALHKLSRLPSGGGNPPSQHRSGLPPTGPTRPSCSGGQPRVRGYMVWRSHYISLRPRRPCQAHDPSPLARIHPANRADKACVKGSFSLLPQQQTVGQHFNCQCGDSLPAQHQCSCRVGKHVSLKPRGPAQPRHIGNAGARAEVASATAAAKELGKQAKLRRCWDCCVTHAKPKTVLEALWPGRLSWKPRIPCPAIPNPPHPLKPNTRGALSAGVPHLAPRSPGSCPGLLPRSPKRQCESS